MAVLNLIGRARKRFMVSSSDPICTPVNDVAAPLAEPSPANPDRVSPHSDQPPPPLARVLCVDDDVMILSGLQHQLRRQFDVVGALGREKALKTLQERGPFAAILSDLQMPGMNGLEFLSRARDIAPDTPRMVLSGKADIATAIRAMNDGIVFRFPTKPCEADVLAANVHTAVEEYDLTRRRNALLEGVSEQVRTTLTEIGSQAEESRRHLRELSDSGDTRCQHHAEDERCDPSSGLPDSAQAEAAISAILEAGDSMAVAVFCVQRMGFTLSRYGRAVGAKVLLVSGQHLASALEAHTATLFRMKGPAFVALIPNEKPSWPSRTTCRSPRHWSAISTSKARGAPSTCPSASPSKSSR